MIEEEFRPIVGHPGYYVSNLGRVKSEKFKNERILSLTISRLGYVLIQLIENCKTKSFQLGRIVLEAFVGFPADPWLCYVHHKDGDLTNCKLDNLEWVVCKTTAEYDPAKSHRRGVLKPSTTKERMVLAKLNQSQETIEKGIKARQQTMLNKRINNGK